MHGKATGSSPASSAATMPEGGVIASAAVDLPWGCTFEADCDDELVSAEQLRQWLDIAGRRIDLGDGPEKSGEFGYAVADIVAG